ncbi:MAG: hypothetical protein Q7S27_00805 [Nanoarchaeota archaeon]|nr:hypothetical protein [Nanoarchaeota archaeon]
MARKKSTVGKRKGNILFDEVDLKTLKLLIGSKEEFSIGDVQDKIGITHVSFKIHFRRLEKLGFITIERIPKTFKHILKPTEKGKKLLELFEK